MPKLLNKINLPQYAAAPGSPAQGDMYYNTADDTVYVYDGTQWLDLTAGGGGVGDITDVVAGNGLTGGSSSGSATLDVGAGTGITVTANEVAVDTTVIATKAYVDAYAPQMNWHGAVDLTTAAALPNSPTYANGTADASGGYGVGATLTATTYGALVIDGVTMTNDNEGSRVLIKDQVNAVHNGIYNITEAGTGAIYWILTRSTDSDNHVAGEVSSGDAVFSINGTTNDLTGFVLISEGSAGGVHQLGTDDLDWYQYTGVNAGSGITVTGTTVAVDTGTGLTIDGTGVAVQFSSLTNSASETVAATPLAVSTTYTLADAANSLALGAIQASVVGAKGDIIAASANDTPAIRSVGSNGQLLVADSTEATGLNWLTPPYPNAASAVLTGTVTIDNNTGSPQGLGGLSSETRIQAVSADGQNSAIVLDGHGTSKHGKLISRVSRGTAASPTATQSGDIMAEVAAFGYGATGYGSSPSATIRVSATENMTDSALGGKMEVLLVPNGSTSPATAATITSTTLDLPTGSDYKINSTSVLSASTLGSGVTASSLTSVGTIATGVWQGTAVGIAYGGTGQTTAANAANALLPSQTGLAGRVLATDGAGTLSWYDIDISNETIDGGSA
jgi:hypothetical protein